MATVAIHSTVKRYPRLPYTEIASDILGHRYQLSLTFVGRQRAQRINVETRGKDYVPNVLSFPLEDHCGEIIICPDVAKREANRFGHSTRQHIGFLFIHGCLHLKGYDHGATMERAEQRWLTKYIPRS